MSYYEHVLQESYDWIIGALNDKREWPDLKASIQAYFLGEWRKRALQGDTLEDAAAVKIDDENNTTATMASGDLNCDLTLWLADAIERFVITVNKYGVFDSSAA